MPDRRRGPRSEAHSQAISRGVRRSYWSDRQSVLAHEGRAHDLVIATHTFTMRNGRQVVAGQCHWCQFWGVNPGRHTDPDSEACLFDPSHQHHSHDDAATV